MAAGSSVAGNASRGDAYPPAGYAWTVVIVLFLLGILSYTDRYVLSLLIDPIRQELGIDDVQISLLLGTAFAVVYAVFGVITGLLADRGNRRNLVMAGVVVWSVATMACGLAESFRGIFAARMLVGLGEAILTPAAISLIGDYFPPSRRGAAIGVYLMGVPLGSGIAAIIGGAVLKMVQEGMLGPVLDFAGAPWRAVLVILGAPGLALVWLMLIIREPQRREDRSSEQSGARAVSEQSNAATRGAWLRVVPILLGSAGMALAVACVIAWGPAVLIRAFGVPPSEAGLAIGLSFALGGTGGVLLGGILSDRARARYGRTARMWMCLAGAALAIPCTLFGLSDDLTLALAGMGFFIMFVDWTISCSIAAVLEEVPNRSRGLATSLAFFLNVILGAGLGPTLVALVNSRGAEAAQDLGLAIFTVSLPVIVLVLVAFGIATRLARTAHRKTPAVIQPAANG